MQNIMKSSRYSRQIILLCLDEINTISAQKSDQKWPRQAIVGLHIYYYDYYPLHIFQDKPMSQKRTMKNTQLVQN